MIRDLVYTVTATSASKIQLRESHSGREFWITREEFTKNYSKK